MEPNVSVTVIKVEVEVCKETYEIGDALEGLVADIKAGKPVAEIVAGNLGKVMTAVNGFEQLGSEAKNEHFYESAALIGAKITKALIKK